MCVWTTDPLACYCEPHWLWATWQFWLYLFSEPVAFTPSLTEDDYNGKRRIRAQWQVRLRYYYTQWQVRLRYYYTQWQARLRYYYTQWQVRLRYYYTQSQVCLRYYYTQWQVRLRYYYTQWQVRIRYYYTQSRVRLRYYYKLTLKRSNIPTCISVGFPRGMLR